MKLKIESTDSKRIFLLKMLYLIPYIIIMYPIWIVIEGIKEVSFSFKDIIDSYFWNGFEKRRW